MVDDKCRNSAAELKHDTDSVEITPQEFKELVDTERAKILEGTGEEVMELFLEEFDPMLGRALFKAWRSADFGEMGMLIFTRIEQQVVIASENVANYELGIFSCKTFTNYPFTVSRECPVCAKDKPISAFEASELICSSCDADGHWATDSMFIDAGDNAHRF